MAGWMEAVKNRGKEKKPEPRNRSYMQILPEPNQDVPPPVEMKNGKLPPVPNQPVLPVDDIWKRARLSRA